MQCLDFSDGLKKKSQINPGINSENPKKLSHYHCAVAHAVTGNHK